MLLVADSGSSKTDWKLLLSNGKTENFQTAGINPFFSSEKEIFRILSQQNTFTPFSALITDVYFFGAGCVNPDKREIVSNALSSKFVNAFVSVDTDLMGAAYATCGKSAGLNCIIGTESNMTYFDGEQLNEINSGLGYIIGDEGSGTYFGKKLITDYLYGKMPDDLSKQFYLNYKVNKEILIKNVYQKPLPNFYLASFAFFMSDYQDNSYIKNLLYTGFEDYLVNNMLDYPKYQDVTTHFVGSIAYNFKEILLNVCKKYKVNMGTIVEKPIDTLFDFIRKLEA